MFSYNSTKQPNLACMVENNIGKNMTDTVAIKKVKVISDKHSALAGWYTVAMAAYALKDAEVAIFHVTSDEEPVFSHGSLALQADVLLALQNIGLTESALVNHARAMPFLANKYIGWQRKNHVALAGLAKSGVPLGGVNFVHHLARLRNETDNVSLQADQFSLNTMCASLGTFTMPSADHRSILSSLEYGLRVDAKLLSNLLKQLAFELGEVSSLQTNNLDHEDKTVGRETITLDCRISKEHSCKMPLDTLLIETSGLKENVSEVNNLSNEYECTDNGYIERQYVKSRRYSRKFISRRFTKDNKSLSGPFSECSEILLAPNTHDIWQHSSNTIYLFETGVHQLLDNGGLGYRAQQLNTLWPLLSGVNLSTAAANFFNRKSAERYRYWRDIALLPVFLCDRKDTEFWQLKAKLIEAEDLEYAISFYQRTGVFCQLEHYPADLGLIENTLLAFDKYPSASDPLSFAIEIGDLERQLTMIKKQIKQAATQLPQFQ
ncbi:tryptophan 7-halogenase [Alteromonas sp. ZYF713]|nr:tryptophan 7-halogenase [Alteromonas sp. ZYF713]